MSADYIRQYYQLPFLKKGMKVNLAGKDGVITGFSRSGTYLIVEFSNGVTGNVHPTWSMTYYDDAGNIIKQFAD